jgi:hypothetical protein
MEAASIVLELKLHTAPVHQTTVPTVPLSVDLKYKPECNTRTISSTIHITTLVHCTNSEVHYKIEVEHCQTVWDKRP